jgi:hypothetical protein
MVPLLAQIEVVPEATLTIQFFVPVVSVNWWKSVKASSPAEKISN